MIVTRDNKDRLFRFIYGREENKKWTLELYNAVNGTSYTDESEIEIVTIDSVVYMKMKNDVAFLLGGFVNLYEHQSSFNPNMPLRELIYLAGIYSKYVYKKNLNIYGDTQLILPVPRLLVFYNGTDQMPDETILELKNAFPENIRDRSDVEVRVRMININAGHSNEIMRKSETLREYAWFVETVRTKLDSLKDVFLTEEEKKAAMEQAVNEAIDEMPDDYVIKPYIMENRAEVNFMCITEYDEKKTMELFARDAREAQRKKDEAEIARMADTIAAKDDVIAAKEKEIEELKRLLATTK